MKSIKLIILYISLVLFNYYNLSSQISNRLSGVVVDKITEKPLTGATIRIKNSILGAISDKEGRFILSDIKQNNVSIIVSYIGYLSDTIKVNFEKNEIEYVEVKLLPNDYKTKDVIVEGRASGQVKALVDQFEAVNIKNIVSAEMISQFPDLNAAEVMQRIPGVTLQRDQGEGRYVQLRGTPPEFTNFNINGEQIPSPEGDVRYVGMDIIAADQIESIEIAKVLTPDIDADGIGGNVNIITKKAEDSIPQINAVVAGGYSNLRKRNNYQLQFSYGMKYGKFGFNINGSYFNNEYGSDNMEFKYAKGPFWGSTGEGKNNYYVQYRENQLRHYDLVRERLGISTTLDYQFNDNHLIYLRGMSNSFIDDETRRRKIFDCEDALSLNYYINGRIKHEVREREEKQSINTINLGGISNFSIMKVDYEFSYAHAIHSTPDLFRTMFGSSGQYISFKFIQNPEKLPIVTFPDSNNSKNVYQYNTYKFEEMLLENIYVTDKNYTYRINFTIPYELNVSNSGFFKTGFKYRTKDKSRDIMANNYGAYFTTSNVYPGTGPELNLTTVVDGFSENNLLNKGFVIDQMPSASKMKYFYELYSQFFIYDRTKTKMESFGQDYSAKERIYAGYAMFKHDFNNLMILAGLRYERTDVDYQGIKIITERGKYSSMDSLFAKRSTEFLLPQIHLKYSLNENTNLRIAYTETYARPNFEDVIPYREQDREEVKYGNPDLKFPKALNIDFLGEYYGINKINLSGGLFFKQIDDFIFYFKRFAHEGKDFSNYGIVQIEKAVNGLRAKVYGAELQAQFNFFFFDGFISNFGMFLNYTYTNSDAYIGKRLSANYTEAVVIFGQDDLSIYSSTTEQEKISLPGQSKHAANAAFYYDDGIFYCKLSANYHDSFLYKLGADKDLDEYYQESIHFDMTASYRINDNFKIFVDAINLTNEPLKFYLGSRDYPLQQEFYSWWGRIGFRMSF